MEAEHRHPTDALFEPPDKDDISTHRHRVIIGLLGAALPFLVWFVAWLRPLDPAVSLDSISAYYYSGAVAVFSGILASLSVFFVSYDGYNTPDRWKDRVAALIAAVAAVGVAVFPTEAPSKELEPDWWVERIGVLHFVSAGVLFAAFIFFALFLFPKSDQPRESQPPGKKLRNVLFRVCGVVMLVSVIWAGIHARSGDIFWAETIALEAFALSWLVKGRADQAAWELLRRARNPVRLAAQILDVRQRTPTGESGS